MKKDYLSVTYDINRIPKSNYPHQLVQYLKNRFNFQKNFKFVEIGCGRGEYLEAFNHAGFNCVGIDRENAAIEMSQHLEVYKCDVSSEKLPFDDGSINVIFHKSVIEHLYDPKNLMEETIRVLKPGGKVILLTPDWHTQWKHFFEDYTHVHPYDILAISDLLKIYGLNNVSSEIFYQLPVLWKFPIIKLLSKIFQLFTNVNIGRWLTINTGLKFFRFSVELMILGYGEKEGNK